MAEKMGKPKTRGNGQGTAIKRGNTWEARVVVGYHLNAEGTKLVDIRKTKGGFKTKREALAYCPILKQSVERPKKSPTLEYYWKSYEKTSLQELSATKQTSYRIAWNRLKSLHLREISSISVTELKNVVKDNTSTYYPARDMKVLLNHLYKLAGADRWVDKSLPEYIVLPKLEETEREPFTPEEQQLLWKEYEAGNQDAAIPLIMIYTGMMPGELMQLTTDMIDIENKRIVGAGLKTDVRKTSVIYLSSSILPIIQDVIENKTGKVFRYNKDNFYKRYYTALAAAGCRKLTPYSCRHTTATALAIDENIAPQTIKKVMRWTTSKMLDRYAHPGDDDAAAAVESMNPRK